MASSHLRRPHCLSLAPGLIMVWSKYNDSIEVHYILKTGGLLTKRSVFLKLYFFPGTSILAGGGGRGDDGLIFTIDLCSMCRFLWPFTLC